MAEMEKLDKDLKAKADNIADDVANKIVCEGGKCKDLPKGPVCEGANCVVITDSLYNR
jgi:hypothetical protein